DHGGMPSTDTSPDGDAGGDQATLPPPLPVVGVLPGDADPSPDTKEPTHAERRPWHHSTGWWLIAAALLIGAIALITNRSRSDDATAVRTSSTATANVGNDGGSTDASGDVVVRSGADDDVLDIASARLAVTNHSAQRSDYLITVAAESPGGATDVATGLATIDALPPGRTKTVRAQFTTSLRADVEVVVKEVTRTASL